MLGGSSGEIFGSLSDFDFEISILSLSTLIGLPLDIISKCVNILSKPTEPKVSSANLFRVILAHLRLLKL